MMTIVDPCLEGIKEPLNNSHFAKNSSFWRNKFFQKSLYLGKTHFEENLFLYQKSEIFDQKAINQSLLERKNSAGIDH